MMGIWNRAKGALSDLSPKVSGVYGAAIALFILTLLGLFSLTEGYWSKALLMLSSWTRPPSSLVLVPISTETLKEHGQWPLPRTTYVPALERLRKAGAGVVAMDIEFSQSRQGDADLASALSSLPAVLPVWLEWKEGEKARSPGKVSLGDVPQQAVYPSSLLFKSVNGNVGFSNISTGFLGVRRSLLIAKGPEGTPGVHGRGFDFIPSFALRVVMTAKKIAESEIDLKPGRPWLRGKILQVGGGKVPLDENGMGWISYGSREFPVIPFEDLLKGEFDENEVRDKIVLIGVTAPSGQDIKLTPVGAMAGMEVQAHLIESLLSGRFVTPVGRMASLGFLLLLSLILLTALKNRSVNEGAGAGQEESGTETIWMRGGLVAGGVILTAILLYLAAGLVLEVSAPLLLTLFSTIWISRWGQREMERELAASQSSLKAIQTLATVTAGDQELQTILSEISSMTMASLGVATCGVMLLEEETGNLLLQAVHGISVESVDRTLVVGEGICGEALARRKAVNVPDVTEEKSAVKFEKLPPIRSFCCLPLHAHGAPLGVLWIGDPLPIPDEFIPRLEMVGTQLSMAVENARLKKKLGGVYLDALKTLMRAVTYYCPETKGHVERVARYAIMLSGAIDLSHEETEVIRTAALLHDVARVSYFEGRFRQRSSTGEVTGMGYEDWKELEMSLNAGLQILEPLKEVHPVFPILTHLFERWDGKGFPKGLKGEDIPLGSRILAIANAFDDVTSTVVRGAAFPMEQGMIELKRVAGILLDPNLVRKFISLLSQHPAEELGRAMRLTLEGGKQSTGLGSGRIGQGMVS